MKKFEDYLLNEGKSENTVKSYIQSVNGFLKWFDESKGVEFTKLHNENVREYTAYLKTVKQSKPKTVNVKLNALVKFNEFLVEEGVQPEMVIAKNNYVRVQSPYASLAKITQKDVEKFRQLILDSKSRDNKRNYTIVTIMAYSGLRISETLHLKMNDFTFVPGKIIVKDGKGEKTRTVFMSDKIKDALKSWLKVREEKGIDSEYLFVSNRNKPLDRTTVNKLFNEHAEQLGKEITPHDLRHFFCSYAFECGLDVHEVANQAGHSDIQTTLLYLNPTKEELMKKMNRL